MSPSQLAAVHSCRKIANKHNSDSFIRDIHLKAICFFFLTHRSIRRWTSRSSSIFAPGRLATRRWGPLIAAPFRRRRCLLHGGTFWAETAASRRWRPLIALPTRRDFSRRRRFLWGDTSRAEAAASRRCTAYQKVGIRIIFA